MARTSKLLTTRTVQRAEEEIESLGKKGAQTLKLQAIIAAKKHGFTKTADFFGTTKATLISWVKRLNESPERLAVQPGRGRKALLSEKEETTIKEWILANSQLTTDHLRIKIQKELGKELSRSTVHRIIRKLSFSYITPRPRHYKQDPKALAEAKKKSRGNAANNNP
jgi:transposase